MGLDRLDQICGAAPDLRRFWTDLPSNQRQAFTDDGKRWLFFFRELFETVQRRVQYDIPLVGMLTEQHRMHPDIGNLVSYAFYKEQIKNATEDPLTKQPIERVLHPFVSPSMVQQRAILWIDVPQLPYDPGSRSARRHTR